MDEKLGLQVGIHRLGKRPEPLNRYFHYRHAVFHFKFEGDCDIIIPSRLDHHMPACEIAAVVKFWSCLEPPLHHCAVDAPSHRKTPLVVLMFKRLPKEVLYFD